MPRDPERIDRIVEKLREAWKTAPDQRLAQIVSNNAARGGWKPADAYHCEDDVVEAGLDAYLEGKTVKTKIVGLTGFKGSGKSTIAHATGLPVVTLAAPIREACRVIFALEDEHIFDRSIKEKPGPAGVSYRRGAQELGIWVRETFGEDYWIQRAQAEIDSLDADVVVIDDVRFPNEAEWVDVCVGVERPGIGLDDDHVSETSMAENWGRMVDDILVNDSTVDDAVAYLRMRGHLTP
jgi:uncharacterized protein YihD (DUF1040 family)